MKNDTSNDSGEYETTDLYYAAYLQTVGAPMLRTDRQGNGNRLTFVFGTDVVNIKELKAAWFNQTGRVSALLFSNNIKALKHQCHMP